MKAPEKIYIHEASAPELTENLPYHIEYTRTDVIEKKIEDWFADVENGTVITDVKLFSEDLIEYLKK